MLGKLARLLRMIGQDVIYVREGEPQAIAERAAAEGRLLLTRDTRLFRQTSGPALFIQSNYPFHQARQVIRTLALPLESDFLRCVEDNSLLVSVRKTEIQNEVPAYIFSTHETFMRCPECKRIFWAGTHLEGMRGVIRALGDAPLVVDAPGDDAEETEAPLTLDPVLDLHQALEVRFLEHRLALMRGDLPAAERTFRRFSAWIKRHMADEAELVLPVYTGSVRETGFERGAAPDIFAREHDKIREHLETIETALIGLRTLDRSKDPQALAVACLELLDREKILVDLSEHHDRRERAFLYPTLEQIMSEAEKLALIERMVGTTEEFSRGSEHES